MIRDRGPVSWQEYLTAYFKPGNGQNTKREVWFQQHIDGISTIRKLKVSSQPSGVQKLLETPQSAGERQRLSTAADTPEKQRHSIPVPHLQTEAFSPPKELECHSVLTDR